MNRYYLLAAVLLLAAIPLACGSGGGSDPGPTGPTGPGNTATFTPTGSFTPTITPTKTPTRTPTNTSTPTVTPTPPSTLNIIKGTGNTFSPSAPVTLKVGGTVNWTDSNFGVGTASHTLYIDTGNNATCSATPVAQGYPASVVFTTTGTYRFHCSIHTTCGTSCSGCSGGMSGTIVVVP